MKHTAASLAALAFALAATAASALDEHQVVFTEGAPIRRHQGGEEEIAIGDVMLAGQTIVTGAGDSVELEAGTYKVKVAENTVFTLLEAEQGGRNQPVLAAALGRLNFVRQRLGGSEPRLAGSSAICGVRGTEVTVLAGADGSTLFIVDEGSIEVSAAGATVALGKGEAVEVATGAAPGSKYQALSRQVDYSKWNQGKLDAMLGDPVAAAQKVEKQLDAYIEQMRTIMPLYQQKRAALERERAAVADLRAKNDTARMQQHYKDVVFPLELETTRLYVNVRYYALSALSLRRFVGGRAYAMLKAKYATSPDAAAYRGYLAIHRAVLDKFEREVVPHLVPADI